MLHQVKTSKLMAIWDYKGKLESQGWSQEQSLHILKACLLSPPGKMLQCFAQAVCNAILLKLHTCFEEPPEVEVRASSRGLMSNIPFFPLEEKATTRVTAAQADDVKVDLLAWSSPLETEFKAQARVVLRRFAARWRAYNLNREAMRWWNWNGCKPQDLAAIQDCIYPARASSYWHWHHGSHLFFWRFPKEFCFQMRDGTPFYHIAPSPVDYVHNMPSPSRQAEIETRKRFSNFAIGISLRGDLPISSCNFF